MVARGARDPRADAHRRRRDGRVVLRRHGALLALGDVRLRVPRPAPEGRPRRRRALGTHEGPRVHRDRGHDAGRRGAVRPRGATAVLVRRRAPQRGVVEPARAIPRAVRLRQLGRRRRLLGRQEKEEAPHAQHPVRRRLRLGARLALVPRRDPGAAHERRQRGQDLPLRRHGTRRRQGGPRAALRVPLAPDARGALPRPRPLACLQGAPRAGSSVFNVVECGGQHRCGRRGRLATPTWRPRGGRQAGGVRPARGARARLDARGTDARRARRPVRRLGQGDQALWRRRPGGGVQGRPPRRRRPGARAADGVPQQEAQGGPAQAERGSRGRSAACTGRGRDRGSRRGTQTGQRRRAFGDRSRAHAGRAPQEAEGPQEEAQGGRRAQSQGRRRRGRPVGRPAREARPRRRPRGRARRRRGQTRGALVDLGSRCPGWASSVVGGRRSLVVVSRENGALWGALPWFGRVAPRSSSSRLDVVCRVGDLSRTFQQHSTCFVGTIARGAHGHMVSPSPR
mmetsp:Transcript_958/g.3796  ORF Transcript_958/g.3796 Transcript_958/m.3796 type:complete len:511 (-) Transcript_958:26-1558(-)